MVVTSCSLWKKTSDLFEKNSRLARMYASPWIIFQDYEALYDSQNTTSKAFMSITPFANKLKEWWQFNKIWKNIVSPSYWDSVYADKMQKALNTYIWEAPDWITFENLRPWQWAWQKFWEYITDPTEQQFIRELAWALNSFLESYRIAWNDNLYTLVHGAINDWVLWQHISKIDNQKWTWLWWLIWVMSRSWTWSNNVLWLLWLYDWWNNTYTLRMRDWTEKEYRIKDLYNKDDDIMAEVRWAVFANWNQYSNDPIIQNPWAYRNAIKAFMKATDKDASQWVLTMITNKLLKRWAIWKMSAYMLNFVAWTMQWASCLTTWYLNMMSYNKKNSNTKIDDVLKQMWLKKDYFKFNKDLKSRFMDSAQSYFWKWTNDFSLKDYSRNNSLLLDNEMYSWMLMWPANILWDTIWRWKYQYIAMDAALQKLWWEWDIANYLYKTDASWRRIPDLDAYALLLTTFINKMADVTWFSAVEWWSQLIWQFDVSKWTSKRLLKTTFNIWLKMRSWMSNWATNYVNNTYKILMWWAVNAFTTQEQKDNAYKWAWWNWLIRRYTRWIEVWDYTMPWEHAQALVSKQEFATELMRFVAWVRNMYRLWNIACRDQETWELDERCALKNFMSVAYLPSQAAQMAHPIIRWVVDSVTDYVKYSNYFEDKDLWTTNAAIIEDSLTTNIIKPMLRSLYALKLPADVYERVRYWEMSFEEALIDAVMDSSDWFLYYISDEISSYVHPYWAYWPMNLLNNDTTIFWNVLELRDELSAMNRIKSIEALSRDWLKWWVHKLKNLSSLTRTITSEDAAWVFESSKADKMLSDWSKDKDILEMSNWKFTDEMKDDDEFMQYVWTNLTQDRQTYWASFKEWVRDSKYNKTEIDYFETLLKKDMDEAAIANPWLSDLEIYDAALKKFFEWTPTYQEIKDAIQELNDIWETPRWVYTDYLASAAWLEETAWVKWLALVAEYRKRQLMEEEWLQYSSKQTAAEKAALQDIENKVAWELWPYLWLADRRQYENLEWRWFVQKHPEYENYDPFENLKDKNWDRNVNADVKQTWVLWTALRAYNLARTELILWNTNWYELSNVFTEKFWSAINENWDFDELKAKQMIDSMLYFSQALEDSWKLPADIALILAPTLTKNLELRDYVLDDESEQSKAFRDKLWEEWVDQIRWLLYDTYKAINDLPELLEVLETEDFVDKVISSWYKWYSKWWRWWYWGSLYHWNNTKKNYDYYNKPANTFNGWWSKNLSKLANGYGKTGKRNYAWNYSPREFYFLNQRSYRNNIISSRIAPDIPLSIWGFSKTTVKSKNPVSWFTTNIKPWEKGATPKFGKGKGIIWWEQSRWPITHFKA